RMALVMGAHAACAMGLLLGGCAVESGGGDPESGGLELGAPGDFRSGSVEGDATTQKMCTVVREDVYTTVTIGTGSYGSWNCWDYCSAGSFAYGVQLRSESSRGSGDDTALNAVLLECYYRNTGGYAGYVTSGQNGWGWWMTPAYSNPSTTDNPFKGGRMRIEPGQGSGDDTMGNQVALTAMNGVETVPSAATSWGNWNGTTSCPAGTAVCGIQTRTEGSQGNGDDTALNGVKLACCTF
ncbi:MAG TPA: hypothetical protein VIM73_22535, partial [Polyangiaceae bacterium]